MHQYGTKFRRSIFIILEILTSNPDHAFILYVQRKENDDVAIFKQTCLKLITDICAIFWHTAYTHAHIVIFCYLETCALQCNTQ